MKMTIDCPGRYCGIISVNDEDNSLECSACPVGFRTNETKHCAKCTSHPELYEWMYMVFMFVLPLFFNWLFIEVYLQKCKLSHIKHCVSALVETVLAVIISILLFEPKGELDLISCPVIYLSDWYTIFYNPTIKYSKTLYCAQEAIYPLYSIVFVCYLFSLLLMLIIRPLLAYNCSKTSYGKKQSRKVYYAALYFHPLLIVCHALLAGLIYYSYSYVVILIALLTSTIYLAASDLLVVSGLFLKKGIRHWIVILWQFAMLSYALVAIIQAYLPPGSLFSNSSSLPCFAIIPVPILFLIATEKLSDPNGIEAQL